MEENYVYFENLDSISQEVIVDLFVSIIEQKKKVNERGDENESICNLCEIEQGPSRCIM
jgi:hypothetical protein